MKLHTKSQFLDRALAETVAWCSAQPLVSESPETPDTLRRRSFMERAGKLLREATQKYQNAYKTTEWLEAMEMLKEAAPDSLALLEYQLRSPELRPDVTFDKINSDSLRDGRWDAVANKTRCQEIVSGVTNRRSRLLMSDQQAPILKSPADKMGKLLLYFPSENVADGASRYSSNGFFDHEDAPPWDCWVSYADGELVSWVPNILIPLAQAGIDANPVDCIRWA